MKYDLKGKKIILAYSGGLDTSVMVKWLKEEYGADVIAYTADVGLDEDLKKLKARALATGASRIYIEDLKEEFVSDYIFTAVKANAVYEDSYLMGTSLARPLIAKKQIEIANKESTNLVAHGATGKGNDQVRFELTYYTLDPSIQIIAPWRLWSFRSRTDLMNYAQENGIDITATKEKPYSIDRNLMHSSYEGGILEDPWTEPPEDIFMMTKSPEDSPNSPFYLEIGFEKGIPVSVNGQIFSPANLLQTLNAIGGEYAIGRVDLVENRFVGMKSRGVYETPGVTILYRAHRALESIVLDREVMHFKDSLGTKISEMIYYGFWFSPEFSMIRNLIDESQKTVTGTTRLKLYKGNCAVVGRKSPYSLYSSELATFEEDSVYDHRDAEGFIKLNALRLRLKAFKDDLMFPVNPSSADVQRES